MRPFLLFDLGGVLMDNTGPEALRQWLPEPLDTVEVKRRWLDSEWVRRFELGQIDAASFAAGFVDDWRLACSPRHFIEAFASWPQGFPTGARPLLGALRRAGPIGCLSNSNAVHWRRFDSFAGVFDVALSSHLTGRIKPDRASFDHAIERCGVAAEHLWFFDDMAANVDAARAAGLRATQVDGFAALLAALQAGGMIEHLDDGSGGLPGRSQT